QPGPCRRRSLIVNSAPITDAAFLLNRAHTLADPGCQLSTLTHEDALPLSIQGTVRSNGGPIRSGFVFLHSKQSAVGLKGGLHFGRPCRIRKDSAGCHFSLRFAYPFSLPSIPLLIFLLPSS